MNVRIYQINMKRDANNVAFMNYESLPKFQGSSEIDSSLYDKVFEGEVNCFTLEKLYEIFNLEHPAGYKGRSMSVSDVVDQFLNVHLPGVEDGRRQPRIDAGVGEELGKVLHFPGAAAGDDG